MSSQTLSIIVPYYNKAAYIAETLDSLLRQTYTDWECIIVDDGSTDNGAAIIESYTAKDSRFKSIRIPNGGVSNARNVGIRMAAGDIIFPFDADDILVETHLQKVMEVFAANPNARMVYTGVRQFGAVNADYELEPYDYSRMLRSNMVHGTIYLKKDFEKVGGYRLNMVHGLEDWDFWIALLEDFKPGEVVYIPERLFLYRTSEDSRAVQLGKEQKVSKMLDNMVLNNFLIYQKYYPDIFERIMSHDFNDTMMKKGPVKFLVSQMMKLSTWKNKVVGRIKAKPNNQ